MVATLLRLKALTATVECEREVLAMLEGGAPVIIPDEYCGSSYPTTTPTTTDTAANAASEPFAVPEKLKEGVKCKVVSSTTIVPYSKGSSSIHEVVLDTDGALPYYEGQCVSLLPPGDDPKTGKPHKKRRMSVIQ